MYRCMYRIDVSICTVQFFVQVSGTLLLHSIKYNANVVSNLGLYFGCLLSARVE